MDVREIWSFGRTETHEIHNASYTNVEREKIKIQVKFPFSNSKIVYLHNDMNVEIICNSILLKHVINCGSISRNCTKLFTFTSYVIFQAFLTVLGAAIANETEERVRFAWICHETEF